MKTRHRSCHISEECRVPQHVGRRRRGGDVLPGHGLQSPSLQQQGVLLDGRVVEVGGVGGEALVVVATVRQQHDLNHDGNVVPPQEHYLGARLPGLPTLRGTHRGHKVTNSNSCKGDCFRERVRFLGTALSSPSPTP